MRKDIINKVLQDFPAENQEEVLSILEKKLEDNLSLGMIDQTLRALVFLANGDIIKLKSYLTPERYFEPRDIVCEAEEEAGNPDHWFALPFDLLETLSAEEIRAEINKMDESQQEGDDNPF